MFLACAPGAFSAVIVAVYVVPAGMVLAPSFVMSKERSPMVWPFSSLVVVELVTESVGV